MKTPLHTINIAVYNAKLFGVHLWSTVQCIRTRATSFAQGHAIGVVKKMILEDEHRYLRTKFQLTDTQVNELVDLIQCRYNADIFAMYHIEIKQHEIEPVEVRD